jgi:DNA-binding Lrp family transcriptional regulator
MADNEISVKVTAQTNQLSDGLNNAAQGVSNLTSNIGASLNKMTSSAAQATSQTTSLFSNMLNQLGAIGTGLAGIFSVAYVANFTKEAAMLAARVETLGIVLKVVGENAGYSSQESIKFVEAVKKMGITTEVAHDAVIKLAQANIPLEESARLARIAQDAAVIGNVNSSEAFSRMIQGIRSGETEILKNLGLQVSLEGAYRKAAKELKISTEELTQHQKTMAGLAAVKEAGLRIEGTYEAALGSTGKIMQSMKRYADELKLAFGQLFSGALTSAVNLLSDGLKNATAWMESMRSSGAIEKMSESLSTLLQPAWSMVKTTIETILNLIQIFKPMMSDFASGALPVLSSVTEGWRYMFVVIGGVVEFVGKAVMNVYDLGKAIGNAATAAASSLLGQKEAAQIAMKGVNDSLASIEARGDLGMRKTLERLDKEVAAVAESAKKKVAINQEAIEWESQLKANQSKKDIADREKKEQELLKKNKTIESRLPEWKAALEQQLMAEKAYYGVSISKELDYWNAKLAMTKNGSKEQIKERNDVISQIWALEKKQAKEEVDIQLDALNQMAKNYEFDYDAKLSIEQQKQDLVLKTYGAESKEYRNLINSEMDMIRQRTKAEEEAALKRVEHATKLATMDIGTKERKVDTSEALGITSAREALDIKRGLALEAQQLEMNRVDFEIANNTKGLLALQELENKKIELKRSHAEAIGKIDDKLMLETKKTFDSIIEPINSAISTSIQGMIMGTTTLQKALSNLYQSILASFVGMCVKMLLEYIRNKTMEMMFGKSVAAADVAVTSASAIQKTAVVVPAAMTQIGANAGVAGSGAAASQASIPYVGPALAVAAAAAMIAMVLGFRKMASASGGWDVDRDGMAYIHKEEMVLPAGLAGGFREMFAGGGQSPAMAGAGGGGTTIIQAWDSKDVSRFFKSNGNAVYDAMKGPKRNFRGMHKKL